jgi:hypothetical protein
MRNEERLPVNPLRRLYSLVSVRLSTSIAERHLWDGTASDARRFDNTGLPDGTTMAYEYS